MWQSSVAAAVVTCKKNIAAWLQWCRRNQRPSVAGVIPREERAPVIQKHSTYFNVPHGGTKLDIALCWRQRRAVTHSTDLDAHRRTQASEWRLCSRWLCLGEKDSNWNRSLSMCGPSQQSVTYWLSMTPLAGHDAITTLTRESLHGLDDRVSSSRWPWLLGFTSDHQLWFFYQDWRRALSKMYLR